MLGVSTTLSPLNTTLLGGVKAAPQYNGTPPYAPVIAIASVGNDNRPDFEIQFPYGNGSPFDVVAGDVLSIEMSTDNATWSSYITHTVTSGEIAGDPVAISGVQALDDGLWYFRAKLTRGLAASDYSLSVSITIDVISPELSSAAGAQVLSTTASISVTTNEGNGTLYYVVTTTNEQPSASQIVAGHNASDGAPIASGSQAVSSTGTKTISLSGLETVIHYVWFVQIDAASNTSDIVSASWSQVALHPTATLTGNASNTADSSAYTFNAIPIGDGFSGRRVVVCVEARAATGQTQVLSGVTINGVSASSVSNYRSTADGFLTIVGIFELVVDSGSTCDVVASFSGAMSRCAVQLFTLSGAASPSSSNSANYTNDPPSGGSVSATLDATGGCVIGCFAATSIGTVTTSNLTTAHSEVVESVTTVAAAYKNSVNGSLTYSIGCSAAPLRIAAFAVWTP